MIICIHVIKKLSKEIKEDMEYIKITCSHLAGNIWLSFKVGTCRVLATCMKCFSNQTITDNIK